MSPINHDRAALEEAAWLPLAEAARLLGGTRTLAVAWLRSEGLVHPNPVSGEDFVIWGDVLTRIRALRSHSELVEASAARVSGLRRKAL